MLGPPVVCHHLPLCDESGYIDFIFNVYGRVAAVLTDDMGNVTGGGTDSRLYRVALETGETRDFGRRDVRPPITEPGNHDLVRPDTGGCQRTTITYSAGRLWIGDHSVQRIPDWVVVSLCTVSVIPCG